ncbi:MAG: hypothetical protein L7U83_13760, partial [Akkermansiaceae bacterium]|nr:hypothetical protein [Akkermansiaceae bacterium]
FEAVKEDLSDSLDDLKRYAKLGKTEAIHQLVSIANQITNFLNNGVGINKSPFEESEKGSQGPIDCPLWREMVDESVGSLLEEEVSTLEQSLDSTAKDFPESYLVFPPLSPPHFIPPPSLLNKDLEDQETEDDKETEEDEETKEARGARILKEDREIKTQLVAQLIGRLIQNRLNRSAERSFSEIASTSKVWPVSLTRTDAFFFRDKLPPKTLPKAFALNLPKTSPKFRRGGPVDFTLAIFEALDEERSKRYSPKHLQDLKVDDDREREDDAFKHIQQLATDEKLAAIGKSLVVGRYDEKSGQFVDSEGNSIVKPTLSSVWRRKAALLPLLEKTTVGEWVSAALFYLGYHCNGKFEDQQWPETVNSASRKYNGIRPGIRNTVKQGFETISEIFSSTSKSASQD